MISATVLSYLREWLELQRTQLQPSTLRSYRLAVENYLGPRIGHVTLDELDPPTLTRLYGDLLVRGGLHGKPLSLKSVRYVHSVLHKALEDARRAGLVARNVSDDAVLPRVDPRTGETDERRHQTWTAAQLRTFLAAVEHHPHRWLWHVAAGTGMRRGELLGLTWEHVDLRQGVLRVRQALTAANGETRLKATKTGRPRTLHLDQHTSDALREQRRHQEDLREAARTGWGNPWDLVFTTRVGGPVHPSIVTREFAHAVQVLPVPRIRLHDLRHTHATLLLEAGVPVKVVSERLGHASIQLTLDTYAHVLPSMDSDAAERFAEHVWGAHDHRPPDEGRDAALTDGNSIGTLL